MVTASERSRIRFLISANIRDLLDSAKANPLVRASDYRPSSIGSSTQARLPKITNSIWLASAEYDGAKLD